MVNLWVLVLVLRLDNQSCLSESETNTRMLPLRPSEDPSSNSQADKRYSVTVIIFNVDCLVCSCFFVGSP